MGLLWLTFSALVATLATAVVDSALAPATATFFVAFNGSDANSGLERARPFASVDKALLAVSALQMANSGSPTGPVNIVLLPGVLFAASTVRLTPASCGSSSSLPLTIAAEEGAVLSGGTVISNWHPVVGSDGSLFTANLPLDKFPQTIVRHCSRGYQHSSVS